MLQGIRQTLMECSLQLKVEKLKLDISGMQKDMVLPLKGQQPIAKGIVQPHLENIRTQREIIQKLMGIVLMLKVIIQMQRVIIHIQKVRIQLLLYMMILQNHGVLEKQHMQKE